MGTKSTSSNNVGMNKTDQCIDQCIDQYFHLCFRRTWWRTKGWGHGCWRSSSSSSVDQVSLPLSIQRYWSGIDQIGYFPCVPSYCLHLLSEHKLTKTQKFRRRKVIFGVVRVCGRGLSFHSKCHAASVWQRPQRDDRSIGCWSERAQSGSGRLLTGGLSLIRIQLIDYWLIVSCEWTCTVSRTRNNNNNKNSKNFKRKVHVWK